MKNTIPDKVSYTKGEKIAEALALFLLTGSMVYCIVMMCLDLSDGSGIILLVVAMIEYGAFTICSVYPQWTNIVDAPEKATEKKFRHIRRSCIIAKLILLLALITLQIIK